ncbi:CoA ester lyase [Inquilinus limosus]|uniref:HpcH/HpaI aldolase/citrate lyase family protein n=1 Tax=Inquilinus limosus TaxID=171674 RepID=UPI0004014845|nr:CoA ester lyase [Inquilinus limosus]
MIRSLLYVPASEPRFIEKAHTRGADAVILDLEDAVAPSRKAAARDALADSVAQAGRSGAIIYVRINAGPELRFLDAEAACRAGAAGLLVPKTGSAAELADLAGRLAPVEQALGRQPMEFVPLIEDPAALLDARLIAAAPRVAALALGSEDFATATGASPTPETLRLPKLLLHYAAKAAGRRSYGLLRSAADFRDVEALKAAAREARAFGFDGATCIHPAVVPILNEAFAPTEEELAWARRVVEADAAAQREGKGAYLVDGRFVDAPIVERARRILAAAR